MNEGGLALSWPELRHNGTTTIEIRINGGADDTEIKTRGDINA